MVITKPYIHLLSSEVRAREVRASFCDLDASISIRQSLDKPRISVAPILIKPQCTNQQPKKFIIISNAEQDIKKLKEQNDSLRSENRDIQKQISLFKLIFRNPKKHESFFRQYLPGSGSIA